MRFLRRVYAEKRRLILPVAFALVANAVLYAVAVYPLERRVAAAELRSQAAVQSVRAAETMFASAESIASGKAQATSELRSFYEEILPVGLAGARRITYVRLAQAAAESGLQYERRTIRTERDPDSSLARLEMTMVLAGRYADVRRFIHELETSDEFIVIEDVALAQSEETDAPLVLTVDIATYYRAEDDGGS